MVRYGFIAVRCDNEAKRAEVVRWFKLVSGYNVCFGLLNDINFKYLYIHVSDGSVVGNTGATLDKNLMSYEDWKLTCMRSDMKKTIKTQSLKAYEVVKPYQPYLMALAAMLAIDYLFFKGKGTVKIEALAKRAIAKLTDVVNTGADKLFGPEDTND